MRGRAPLPAGCPRGGNCNCNCNRQLQLQRLPLQLQRLPLQLPRAELAENLAKGTPHACAPGRVCSSCLSYHQRSISEDRVQQFESLAQVDELLQRRK